MQNVKMKPKTQITATKTVKYLFVAVLMLMWIGSTVLILTSINTFISCERMINVINADIADGKYGQNIDMAKNLLQQYRNQRDFAILGLIIYSLSATLAVVGMIGTAREFSTIILAVGITQTTLLFISLFISIPRPGFILVEVSVSVLAFIFVFMLKREVKLHQKKMKKAKPQVIT